MLKLSRIIIASFFCISAIGCNNDKLDTTSNETDNSQNTSTVRSHLSQQDMQRKLPEDEFFREPLKMYIRNKELIAQAELRNTYSRNSARDDNSSVEERKMEDIRDNFTSNNYELAYQKGKDLLANPNTTPQLRAEIYFMFANMTKEYSANEESLDYIGKAYEALKEIHKQPEVSEKVNSFNKLNENINEINNFTPQEETEEED